MQFSIDKSEMTWKSNTGKFDFAFLIFCTQQFTKNLTHANITCQKISHTQVNSAFHVHWFLCSEEISKYYSLPSRWRDKINFNHFLLYWQKWTNFFLVSVWYISKQYYYSPKCWWILVDINWATKWQGKYPPLFTSTEVKYNC